MKGRLQHLWLPVAAALGALALWQPAALYLVALAVFGLPHVMWEMAWVWPLWRDRVPRLVWVGLLAALLLQAAARLGLWFGRIDAPTASACDAATLALALLATLGLAPRLSAGRRLLFVAVALGLPIALLWLADTPQVLGVLAVLAIAHNFTPVALAPAHARIGAWPARQVLLAVLRAAAVVCHADAARCAVGQRADAAGGTRLASAACAAVGRRDAACVGVGAMPALPVGDSPDATRNR